MNQSNQHGAITGSDLIAKVGGMRQAHHILNMVEDDTQYIGFMYLQYKLSSDNPDDKALILHDDNTWHASSYFNHEFGQINKHRFICINDLNNAVLVAEKDRAAMAAFIGLDSVCGVVWGVDGVVEGESATALLQRLDAGFHARVEQVIKDSPHLCVNRNSDEWPGDFMRTLQGQVMDYLNEHPIRKQALELAAMEYVLPPIVMSREEFERTYIGTFIRDKSQCKCGTSWDAMLYGAECGRCGEKRPVPHGAPCAVSDDPISAVAIAFLDGRV